MASMTWERFFEARKLMKERYEKIKPFWEMTAEELEAEAEKITMVLSGFFDPTYNAPELKVWCESGAFITRANVTSTYKGDAGLDLYLYESIELTEVGGKPVMARTGIRMAIPENYVGILAERSSAGPKYHLSLSNKLGVIDSSYRDELLMALTLRPGDEPMRIEAGERLCQLLIVPILRPNMVFVDAVENLPMSVRTGGFGSTG